MSSAPDLRSGAAVDAAVAAHAARVRIAAVADELAEADAGLDDARHAALLRLVDGVIGAIEDALRLALADLLREARPDLATLLERTERLLDAPVERLGLRRDPDLLAALLRRVEAHRLAQRAPAGGGGPLERFVADGPAQLAEAAMAVIVGTARRLDSFREPAPARGDLPAELHHRLVWQIAAALRLWLVAEQRVAPRVGDALVAGAAERVLTGYDETDALEARAARLARALDFEGLLDDALLLALLRHGEVATLVAALSLRAALPQEAAWDRLLDSDPAQPALLLRAAGLARQGAADLLLELDGPDRLGRALTVFESIGAEEARLALGFWRLDEVYRRAQADLVDRRRSAA